MPRLARLDAHGVLHHVMGRGIEGSKIYLSDIDRNDFIDRLSTMAQDGAMEIYAWVLMPNHFHILCKTKNLPLASIMRRILTGYVVNFNPAKSGIIADTDIYFSPRRRLHPPACKPYGLEAEPEAKPL